MPTQLLLYAVLLINVIRLEYLKYANPYESIRIAQGRMIQGLVCLQAANCNKIYGWDALDIANFGVLPPCSKPGFLRLAHSFIKVDFPISPVKLVFLL